MTITAMPKNILVVYACAQYPIRSTLWEHLQAFRNYSGERVFYLNLAMRNQIPGFLLAVDFDLIIFSTLFMTHHWVGPEYFHDLMRKAAPLKHSSAVKAILPQDEFHASNLFSEFIHEFGIDCVFSVAPPSTWAQIYPTVDFARTRFYNVLTGYLDPKVLPKITAQSQSIRQRPIDIGYRTSGKPNFWYGRHGFIKQQIAEVFQEAAPLKGLKVDISTNNADAFLGHDWYRFLAECKYTIGVEGGTSMLDPDGSLRARTETYLAGHPLASFAEVEANCFPGLDGHCQLYAISPRHLEACATRTCQVLTEGHYNGILQPGRHYIEIKKDFSNLEAVLEMIARDDLRCEMVERAYLDIVASGLYTYKHFVDFVTRQSTEGRSSKNKSSAQLFWTSMLYRWMWVIDKLEWCWIKCKSSPTVQPVIKLLKKVLRKGV